METPEEMRSSCKIVRRAVFVIGEPREDVDAVVRDPIGMLAGDEPTAAKLQDLKDADLPVGGVLDAERDDRVGDGELGRFGRFSALVVLTDPKRCGLGRRQVAGQIMEEPAKCPIIGQRTP